MSNLSLLATTVAITKNKDVDRTQSQKFIKILEFFSANPLILPKLIQR